MNFESCPVAQSKMDWHAAANVTIDVSCRNLTIHQNWISSDNDMLPLGCFLFVDCVGEHIEVPQEELAI